MLIHEEFCDLIIKLVVRDVEQLGRPLDQVITHYLEIVKPSFEQFTLPVHSMFNKYNQFWFGLYFLFWSTALFSFRFCVVQEARKRDHPARRREPGGDFSDRAADL